MIGGVPIKGFCRNCPYKDNCNKDLSKIFDDVKNSAYTIISKKGATNYGIASATTVLVESIIKNEGRVYTPSVLLDDIYIGYPAVINKDGVERTIDITLNDEETEKFESSKSIIKEYLESIKNLL